MSSASKLTVTLPLTKHPGSPDSKRRDRPATLAPGRQVGTWQVESELGRGGMGSVYAVHHIEFGKRAALKLCHASVLGPQYTSETFLREARVVNLVNHPGVADVFATGTYDGRPYLAMEHLVGKTLGARMEEGPLDPDEAIEILLELCAVLEAAHAVGVVHRDLKLDNVFLLDEPVAGHRVKLLDWGVARIIGEADPMSGMIAGTLTYVAPEQVRDEPTTQASDVYSLAVLAYRLLLGQVPFAAEADLELIKQHLEATPPRPSKLWPEVPPALDDCLVEMLAKQPADRPAIAEVIHVLRAIRSVAEPVKRSLLDELRGTPIAPQVDALGRPAPRHAAARTNLLRAGIALAAVLTAAVGIFAS